LLFSEITPFARMSKTLHRQAFFYTLINYVGTAIGVISVLFIYPMDLEFLGTVRYIDNIAQILYPIMVLGASHALIKFYPALNDEKRRQLFNYSIASIAVISLLILSGIALFHVMADHKDIALFYIAFPIAVSLAFIDLFRKQAQDLQKLAVPTLYEKLFPKIVLPLLFLLLLQQYLSESESLLLYMGCYVLIFLLTAQYLFKHFRPGFNYRFKTLFGEISRKDYFRYSLYAFAGSFGSLLAFRIDGFIVYNLISEAANGIFSIGVTLSSTLQIPAIGIFALYSPIISEYLKTGNFGDLHMKYKEVARLLFFIGGILYNCIFLGIGDLFMMLPSHDKLMMALPVILILGLNVLINMATGFSTEIITYSKYYRFNMIAILSLIAVNVPLNLFVVYYTDWGIAGIAWASFISMVLFNLSKLIFIYKKFRLLPFDMNFLKLSIVFLLSGITMYYIDFGSNLLNVVCKCGLSLVINIVAAYKLKLVYQVNFSIDKVLRRIKK
jgi:O-antigen/teichoic acid export membrane protein